MRTSRSHLLLIGFILAALVGSLLLALPGTPAHKKPTLGLDLQGGLEVVLKAVPPKGHKLTNDDLIRSRDIMQDRINKLGVSEPDVRTQPPDQIVIQLAGVHDPAKAAAIIGQTAQLQFFDLEADVTGPSKGLQNQVVATPSLYTLLSQVQSKAKGKAGAGPYYLFRTKTVGTGKKAKQKHSLVAGPLPTTKELFRPFHGEQPAGTTLLAVPPGMQVVSCPVANGCPGAQTSAPTYYYLFKYHPNAPEGPPELTGKDLKLSGTRADTDPQKGPIVDLSFTGHGSKMFQKITKAEYDRGKLAASLAGQGGNKDPNTVVQYAGHNAIVLDGQIRSTPYIDYTDPTLSDGISGAAIIDVQSFGEAKDLALVLQTGALPVDFKQIARTDVSATLGKSSLHEAWLAALVGLGIVAVFLLLLYRFLGLVAVLGLGIYAAIFYAAILLIPGVVLTLPGFAGLVLTIGVAADANVVIFERIKEEVRAGKSVRAAIAAGYAKGFHTIIDANVVTGITALVLFAVATAQVKGFAAFLLIGTIISLLTAVAATRAMLGLLAGFRWFGNARFMGAAAAQKGRWLQVDFMRRRYLWFAISGVIIAIGMGALGVKGLNLGIDFKGGTQMSFTSSKPETTGAVQSVFADNHFGDAIVQGRGKSTGGRYTTFQVRTKHLTNAEEARIVEGLRADAALKGQPDVNTVSSSFGRQIARGAILAIIVSLLLIVVYIWIRFGLKFSIPVIVAMLHDVAITVGVYALIGREVSTSSVAAVLTVLGYSIYDTIIIFDRIRENVPLMRRAPFATIANVSLWETIRRSLATTFITLLPVASLLVFGGQTLKDFAFALLVGITSGAYSSIFVAAPLLTIWKEREPEYARRKGRPEEEGLEVDGGKAARRRQRLPIGVPAADTGTVALQESERALANEPISPLLDITPEPAGAGAQARREKRRQRRRTKPHGRAR